MTEITFTEAEIALARKHKVEGRAAERFFCLLRRAPAGMAPEEIAEASRDAMSISNAAIALGINLVGLSSEEMRAAKVAAEAAAARSSAFDSHQRAIPVHGGSCMNETP